MGNGQYWLNGIEKNICAVLQHTENINNISLSFNVDGISPYNSSGLEFWPILFKIEEMPHLKPMIASAYYGNGKPPLNLLLNPIVDELNMIIQRGILVNNNQIGVRIKFFICDTPARCFIKGMQLSYYNKSSDQSET